MKETNSRVKGLAAGLTAHFLWGVAVLFWPLLGYMHPLSLLSQRMVWTCAFILLVLSLSHKLGLLKSVLRDSKKFMLLFASALTLAVNWGVFLWAVTHRHVIDTSLGYYITPLLNILMGRFLLGERMSRIQWIAVLLAGTAVFAASVLYGEIPVLGFGVAVSFAIYGFFHKIAPMDPAVSLGGETLVLLPLAIGWLAYNDPETLGLWGLGNLHVFLLACTVFFTGIPLLLFGQATHSLSLGAIGILQYSSPTISFLIALLWQGETMTPANMIMYPMTAIAVALYMWDALRPLSAVRKAQKAGNNA